MAINGNTNDYNTGSSSGGYTTVTNGATTPIPTGGAGTMIFVGTNFFGFDGTAWRQLNN